MEVDVLGALIATLSALFFAFTVFFIRKSTVKGNPLDAVIATAWINVLIFVPISAIFYHSGLNLNLKSLLAFLTSGLFGTFIARIFYYSGLQRVGASRAVPISRGNLLVASAFGVLMLGESIGLGHLSGICLLAVGVSIVGYELEGETRKKSWKPSLDLLIPLGAMFFMGIAMVLGKIGLSEGTSPAVGLAIKFSIALLALSGFFIYKGRSPIKPFRTDEKKLYIFGGICLSIGFGLYYLALSISRIVVAAPFQGITPLFTLILSYFYLRRLEKVNWILVLGSLLVILGAMMIGICM